MVSTSVSFNITRTILATWANVIKIKNNRTLLYALIALIVALIATVLIVSSNKGLSRGSGTLGFNPYEILNVTTDASKREVKKMYRRMSQKYHPDVAEEKNKELAKQFYIKIQTSHEILTDDTKRKNYDEYGDPDPKWLFITFPSWIMNPGQTFLVIYALLGLVFFTIPLVFLVLNPSLKDPPSLFRQEIYRHIHAAEQHLIDDRLEECRQELQDAQSIWSSLVEQFAAYKQSEWYGIIDFHIVSRQCQTYLFEEDATSALTLFETFAKVHNKTTTLSEPESQYIISPQVKDLRGTLQEAKESADAALVKNKGGKGAAKKKTPTTPLTSGDSTPNAKTNKNAVNEIIRLLGLVAVMPRMKDYDN